MRKSSRPAEENRQTTLMRPVECAGVGLHGGKLVHLGLKPAPANTGVVFDVHDGDRVLRLSPTPRTVIATGFATTLGADGATVGTVEHLLAALRGMHIDNVIVDVSGGEVPIMDGSAASFVLLLHSAGLRHLEAPRRVLRLTRPVAFEQDGKFIKAEPHDGFYVDCTIEFEHPLIRRQRRALEVTPESFAAEIAKARTFGFMREIEYLYAHGLALGGSLDNAVVLDDYTVLNSDGLRFEDEFVRHKILDFIGDVAMYGQPILGKFTLSRSGHALNNAFLRKLEDEAATCLEEVVLPVDEAPAPCSRPRRSHTRLGVGRPVAVAG